MNAWFFWAGMGLIVVASLLYKPKPKARRSRPTSEPSWSRTSPDRDESTGDPTSRIGRPGPVDQGKVVFRIQASRTPACVDPALGHGRLASW